MEKSFVYGVAVNDYNSIPSWFLLADGATEEVLPSAIKELISTNEALYMQQIEPLSGYQMNLLRAIVSGIHSGYNEKKVRAQFDLGSPSNMVRLRDALIERDIIYSEMRQLYITDPVFTLWFRHRFL